MGEPQQDRSRATRMRVLEAAIECLSQLGWTATTVASVADRAGVSRGATQHHFPTREALFTAALDQMAEDRLAEVALRAGAVSTAANRTEAVLLMLANLHTGPAFRAALQVHAAAATDQSLRGQIMHVEARVGAEVHRVAVDLLGVDETVQGVRELVQGTLDMVRGLALADVLADDRRRRRRVVGAWAVALDAALAAAPAATVAGLSPPATMIRPTSDRW